MRAFLSRRRPLAGFTLIELLIVVIIIGILLAIGIPAYLTYQAKAKDTDAKAALQTAYRAAVAGDTEVNSGKFPVASTIVADITADEPAASVVRGDCAGAVANAPVKQVQVDPSSTSSQIVMCVRSASGAIWKLAGPLTGTPMVSDGTTVALTMSGGEITDAVRAAGVQGDGRSSPDSSTGVWDATTNYVANGGFETDTSDWQTGGTYFLAPGATATRTTSTARFGVASAQVTTTNAASQEGIARLSSLSVNSGVPYTLSAWLKGSGTVELGIGNSSVGSAQTAPITLTGTWTRYSVTLTATATGLTGYAIFTSSAQATTFYVDGAQVEAHYTATPYIETNGATAARAGGRVQAPAALVSLNQGWVAVRVRMGWPAAAPARGGVGWDWLFRWGLGSTPRNSIDIVFREPGGAPSPCWSTENWIGNTGTGSACSSTQTFLAGDYLTVIGYWTAANVGISVNGSSFNTATRGGVQTASTLPATIDFGDDAGGGQIDSDILWAATGTGTLTNVDATTIAGFGNTDPSRAAFPSSAQATMVWDGASASGSLK